MSDLEIPYLEGGRELCVTGCAVLWRGKDLLSEAIELCEHGDFSHASAVVRMDEYLGTPDRVTLIEALEHGPTPTLLSNRARDYDGEIYLFTPDGLTAEIQAKFRKFAFEASLKQEPYDFEGLLKQIAGHVHPNPKAVFCSDFWGRDAVSSGLPRKPEFRDNGWAPQPPDIPVWWPGKPVIKLVGPFKEAS
jgi:hypothetical protein